MKVLVIGSGGREHALVRSLVLDPTVTDVWCAPGNGGTDEHATNIDVDASNPAAVAALAQDLGIDLVVVGPEAPLVAGVADAVRAVGIACFGPSAAAAELEGSKAFAKDVMAAAGVPTARAHVCTTNDEAEAALDDFGAPYVVKDDGLAAGKGVVVTSDREEALAHANQCDRVVIEEYLDGPEVSLFIITDGVDALPNDLVDEVIATVVHPTLQEMTKRGTPFSGLLYVGLALTSHGTRVVEFNARFGDPETQAVLARLETPLGELLLAAATGTLSEQPALIWSTGAAVTVVLAAHGYPESPRSGDPITGLDNAEAVEGVMVLHAGTARATDGTLTSSGGRVLSVTAIGETLEQARSRAYEAMTHIDLDGSHYRTDIALKAAHSA
ncbi:MAG: phosphoribosylamine--glycine ligase [Actinobacteria bacterium]|nr:phosphoribosylamine--glycine ligase [Actinomycetota bacterium]